MGPTVRPPERDCKPGLGRAMAANERTDLKKPVRQTTRNPRRARNQLPLRLDRGASDATLAHRMGEGLGVRAPVEGAWCSVHSFTVKKVVRNRKPFAM